MTDQPGDRASTAQLAHDLVMSIRAKAGYSRMLRGMARRVWEMRRSVEHSHQLYAVEYRRNQRLEAELADLREKWPLNGFDEPMNIRQFVANHRAWTERANAEVERLTADLQQLRQVATAARALLDAVESPDRAIYLNECSVLSRELDILDQP